MTCTAATRDGGASFASRTAVYGTSGAAGTAHPLATQTGNRDSQARWICRRRRCRMNAVSAFSSRRRAESGAIVFAMLWDPKQGKVVGTGWIGLRHRGSSLSRSLARARKNGSLPPVGPDTSIPHPVPAMPGGRYISAMGG